MVIDHKAIELHGKVILEKAIMKPPFTMPNFMSEEACLFYVIKGQNKIVSSDDLETLRNNQSILMKCGNYISTAIKEEDEEYYEAVAVHFYPEVLQKVYENDLPKFLTENKENNRAASKLDEDALFKRYIDGIIFYFENPELATE